MRGALLVALVLGALAGLAWLRARPSPIGGVDARVANPATLAPMGFVGSALLPEPNDERPARPRSLRGTRVDGGLVVDADGRFVATLDARRLFDYFLSATGEEPPDAIRARIVREIERRLAAEPAREAVALLDRYLAYRDRVRALATGGSPDVADLEARLATLEALRREILGTAAADAFFAEDEAQARRVLETRRIADDPTLSPEERAKRIEALYAAAEADLPPEVREARAAGRLATTLREAEADVRANGGSAAEVQALRERLAGPEVAARLAELDAKREQWRTRVAGFRADRERIENDPSLDPSARDAAVQALLDRSFTAAERRRVEALDRLEADAR